MVRVSRCVLACRWRLGDLECRTVGFEKLARNVREITKVMVKLPEQYGYYDLDKIWDKISVRE